MRLLGVAIDCVTLLILISKPHIVTATYENEPVHLRFSPRQRPHASNSAGDNIDISKIFSNSLHLQAIAAKSYEFNWHAESQMPILNLYAVDGLLDNVKCVSTSSDGRQKKVAVQLNSRNVSLLQFQPPFLAILHDQSCGAIPPPSPSSSTPNESIYGVCSKDEECAGSLVRQISIKFRFSNPPS